ncbi:MAG: flagellar basal body P-ring protein FlgI [Planctomycetota bacterium]
MTPRSLTLIALAAATLTALALTGCSSSAPKRAVRATVPPRDVPSALRGTIGSIAGIEGTSPALVSGIGFVVGLNGTGGQPVSEQYAATIERQMSLRGIGEPGRYEGTTLEGLTPRQLLQDRNTAVVLIYAAIPIGSRVGDRFDVFVRALNATSLEGGRLWTADLSPGPPATVDQPQTRVLAEAGGEVFVNPFATFGSETEGVTRQVGRVLDGGRVIEGLILTVSLDNPSHARARLIAAAVNARFPRKSGEREETASGRDDERVEVRIPDEYAEKRARFVELIRAMQIDISAPQIYAQRYVTTLRNSPYLASEMAYALEALGEPALPFIRELYDYNDAAPRLAALQAGAGLNDPQATEPLLELAKTGASSLRIDAIESLATLPGGPRIDETLRPMLGEDSLSVRVAAYEALAKRAEAVESSRLLDSQARLRDGRISAQTLDRVDLLASQRLPLGMRQGVAREPIGGKFLLDRVPYGSPLIYVTQQGTPRIVLFGEDFELERPILASVWDDRLVIAADSPTDTHRLYYRAESPAGFSEFEDARVAVVRQEIPESVPGLIQMMAKDPSAFDPEPGLGLSYSEVVGGLQGLQDAGAIAASFATERDRLVADLLSAGDGVPVEARPIAPGDRREVIDIGRELQPAAPLTDPNANGSLLEPVPPRGGSGDN